MKKILLSVLSILLFILAGCHNSSSPIDPAEETPIIETPVIFDAVFTGENSSMVLKKNGTLWAFGNNESGQLGIGNLKEYSAPANILDDVKEVSMGSSHTMVLRTDGTLWSFGSNGCGQLATGTSSSGPGAVPVDTPSKVMSDVASVSAGGDYTMILKTDGTLWGCGNNRYGQLGNGTTLDPWGGQEIPVQIMADVKTVSAGYSHTMILNNDGTLWACGSNREGQLGDGTTEDRPTPVQITMSGVKEVFAGMGRTMILKEDDTLWVCGVTSFGEDEDSIVTTSIPEKVLEDVKKVSQGNYHSMVLKNDGTLWAWGFNDRGQLGDGTFGNSPSFKQVMTGVYDVAAGYEHTVVLKGDDTLWIFGANDQFQFGGIHSIPCRTL